MQRYSIKEALLTDIILALQELKWCRVENIITRIHDEVLTLEAIDYPTPEELGVKVHDGKIGRHQYNNGEWCEGGPVSWCSDLKPGVKKGTRYAFCATCGHEVNIKEVLEDADESQ